MRARLETVVGWPERVVWTIICSMSSRGREGSDSDGEVGWVGETGWVDIDGRAEDMVVV